MVNGPKKLTREQIRRRERRKILRDLKYSTHIHWIDNKPIPHTHYD